MVRKITIAIFLLIALVGTATAQDIQFFRGPEATMPPSTKVGEPRVTTDTHRFFVCYAEGGCQEYAKIDDPRFTDARTPLAHTQDIDTVNGLQEALNGKEPLLGFTPIAGTDPRLSDARTPVAHKGSHATGGGDALSAADIGAEPGDPDIQNHLLDNYNPHLTTAAQIGAEPAAGNPGEDFMCWKSYASGVRYWEACGGSSSSETRTSIVTKIAETPADDTLPLVYKTSSGVEVFRVDPATGTVTINQLVIK